MFNFSGSEIVFLLLIALIVLGPEKLPDAVRKFGKTYAEFKKMTSGFQSELKSALDEPMREMRETADAFKKAATFDVDLESDKPAVKPATPTATPTPEPVPDAAVEAAVDEVIEVGEVVIDQPEPDQPEPDQPEAEAPAKTGLDALVFHTAQVQGTAPPKLTPARPDSVPQAPSIAAPVTRRTPSRASSATFRRAPKQAAVDATDVPVDGSAPPLAPRSADDDGGAASA